MKYFAIFFAVVITVILFNFVKDKFSDKTTG